MRFPDDGDLNNLHVDHPFIVGIVAGRVSPFDLEWMNVLITGGFVRDHRQGRNYRSLYCIVQSKDHETLALHHHGEAQAS
ncbi:hypothetical protein FOBRF1_010466 [Fusarium oxysporum]